MFNWIKKAWSGARQVLGRVKAGVEHGARLFGRGRELYTRAKEVASGLPVVGTVAKELIGKAEEYANKEAKQRLGADFSDLSKGVATAEKIAGYLPRA
jgi:hypothetical protein